MDRAARRGGLPADLEGEAGVTAKGGLDPYAVSPNRLNAYVTCGVAFRARYVDGIPPVATGAATLFGTVIHLALEKWGLNRSQDLPALVESAWLEATQGTSVRSFIGEYAELSRAARALIEEIRVARPDVKKPRLTSDFKDSDVARRTAALLASRLDSLNEGSPWRFAKSSPLPALYDESLTLAESYAERYRHLPAVLVTEFAFEVPFGRWRLRGHIDAIEPTIDRSTGELYLGILDYKTYAAEPPEQKDWHQLVIYRWAVRSMLREGQLPVPPQYAAAPILVGIDYVRLGYRRYWDVDAGSNFLRLRRELSDYSAGVIESRYLPASKHANPDFCDLGDACCLRSTALAGGRAVPVEVMV